MATPEVWQSVSPPIAASPECGPASRGRRGGSVRQAFDERAATLSGAGAPNLPLRSRILKRAVDLAFSSLTLILFAPVFLMIAAAIKFDSTGPVFYLSERIGKNGRVFWCLKFRTMVRDAERRQPSLMHRNERDGVLFKISNDPRVTRVGRFLRKYSLDELPQFINVLRGQMSVVGPRPPIASEVREYNRTHLRRLAVTPGITGLWQTQGRHDPSFESYVSLDLTYIENWSLGLDRKSTRLNSSHSTLSRMPSSA